LSLFYVSYLEIKKWGAEKAFLFSYFISPLGKGQGQALPLQSHFIKISDL
jgi:hypothetical protein